MSQTGDYITVDDVLFNIVAFAGDTEFKVIPRGFHVQQISDAFRELNMSSFLMDGHADFKISDYPEHLSIQLPKDCFDVRNIWIYNGDICDIGASRKVWHKRNFYSMGHGYLANRTGRNTQDPYYLNGTLKNSTTAPLGDKSLIRYNNPSTVNNLLFYNIQNGVLMLSGSCRNAGQKIHIHYASTGCAVGEAPIIPSFYKKAIEDYGTEAALRFRIANDTTGAKNFVYLHQDSKQRLDKEGFYGSWHNAVLKARTMSKGERADLAVYLGKAAWQTGF